MTDVVVELEVAGGPQAVELASADLWAAGATAIGEVEVGERGGGVVKLVASFPTPEAAREVAGEVGGNAVEIIDTSWRDRWKDFAQPVAVGPDLVIAPAWREVRPAGDDQLVIRIDPGPCFGSGSHPSSRLLLGLIMRLELEGQRVLDVGCGSGILAVTAARRGAVVEAIDIDPDAVTITETNAAANGVAERIRASNSPVASVGRDFDLALVNVTARVHALLGRPTSAAVRPGGTLLLAGLLPGQWRHVAGAYPDTEVIDRPSLDGWEGVVLARLS